VVIDSCLWLNSYKEECETWLQQYFQAHQELNKLKQIKKLTGQFKASLRHLGNRTAINQQRTTWLRQFLTTGNANNELIDLAQKKNVDLNQIATLHAEVNDQQQLEQEELISQVEQLAL
jgi:hypothetical protein